MFTKQMLRVLAVVAVGMVFWAGSAQATTITSSTGTGAPPYTPLTTDLANSGQATFASLTSSYPTDWNNGHDYYINNGAGGGVQLPG